MATIYKRNDGIHLYRVQFRRKGLPKFSVGFATLEGAQEFAKKERDYIFNHSEFMRKYKNLPLEQKRKAEFDK